MKTCYNSKCPNIPHTINISRPKCFNSFVNNIYWEYEYILKQKIIYKDLT